MKMHRVALNGDPFLTRLQIIQTPWFAVLLTRIDQPDAPVAPHDHSRSFTSWIISGGYTEDVYLNISNLDSFTRVERKRWSWHVMPQRWAHSLVKVDKPLWTLVLAGKQENKDWHFWTWEGKIPYHQYPGWYQ